MSNEPAAPKQETHATHYVNELTHLQHHCIINQLMMKPTPLDDTLRFERIPHLSRQQIYEALEESDTIEIKRIIYGTYIKDVHDHE